MMKRRNLTARALCEKVGVAPYRFSLYMHDRIPNLNQYQLYEICQELGIKVDINVEMREL
jgi:transcriptional regulator with XRE-family HTH domain